MRAFGIMDTETQMWPEAVNKEALQFFKTARKSLGAERKDVVVEVDQFGAQQVLDVRYALGTLEEVYAESGPTHHLEVGYDNVEFSWSLEFRTRHRFICRTLLLLITSHFDNSFFHHSFFTTN